MNNHGNNDISRTLLLCLSEAARIDAQIVEAWGVEPSSREEINRLGVTLFIQCSQHGLASPSPDAAEHLSPPPARPETLAALGRAAGFLGVEEFATILQEEGESKDTLEASEETATRVLKACRKAWQERKRES